MGHRSDQPGPLDRVLRALRLCNYECRLVPEAPSDVHERAYATCPSCNQSGCLTLEIIEWYEGAEVRFSCWSGCTEESVRRALAADVVSDVAADLRAAA